MQKYKTSYRRPQLATPPEVEKARNVLQEGEELIAQRQKLIRIADRSEHGWATVEEYVDDELADHSEDEKRLLKADVRAAKRLKTSKEKAKKQLVARSRLPFQAQYRPQIQTGAPMYIGQRSAILCVLGGSPLYCS